MGLSTPLTALSPSVQNTKQKTPLRIDQHNYLENESYKSESYESEVTYRMSTDTHQTTSEEDECHETHFNGPGSPPMSAAKPILNNGRSSPLKFLSPRRKQSLDGGRRSAPSPSESSGHPDGASTQTIESSRREDGEDKDNTMHRASIDEGMSTIIQGKQEVNGHDTGDETDITLSIDDTTNDISAFSAIPDADLTRFAALRNSAASPTRTGIEGWSPSKQLRGSAVATPQTVRRPLHLPSRSQSDNSFDGDLTPRRPMCTSSPEDLLNFTGQTNIFIPPPQSSSRTSRRSIGGRGAFPIRVNPSPSHRSQASVDRERSRGTMSPVKETFSTPFADMRTNLLDFDLEPMATPRSIPSITPRELETLRSELSSQISSLSATLSGKEAEVLALKRAITDAEVRVGNTSEELRNEKSLRENLEEEKKDWDRRGREMEAVLREIRQEIMIGEHEREKLRKQAEEAEKRTEEMEVRVVELQTRLESANRRTTLSPTSSPTKKAEDSSSSETTNPATPLPNGTDTDIDVNEAVRLATERVARDLHTLYKSKHETKVSALKKSYEARWEKKVRQLECELKSAQTEIGNLKTERDATMTGPLSPSNALVQQGERNRELLDEQCRISASLLNEKDRIEAEKKMLSAHVEGLESEIGSLRHETDSLRDQLETERIEKGELVAQVDLFLALGEAEPVPQPPSSPPTPRAAARGGESQSRIRSVSSDSITPSTSTSTSTSAATAAAYASPYRQHQHQHQSPARPAAPGAGRAAKPRPISMLQPPGKFSGIPGPGGFRGGAGKGLPAKTGAGIMEGIAKMGRGGAGGY